ncbi:MAG: terpene cyclase/mutase family protein [Oscillospiraceae bacterium]|nr:terpene cyclase/mutase family protein [Oscillospiraceae bacterium]
MKKLLILILIFTLIFSGCGTQKIGTDYDFSKVMEETMANIISNAPNPGHSSIAGEWSIIVSARNGAKVPEGWYETYYNNLCKTLEETSGILTKTKHSNYSRAALAVTAIGKDPMDVNGYNLFEHHDDFEFVSKQGIPGSIFALISLDCLGYEIPGTDRNIFIDHILSEEYEVGGWALKGEEPDVDITAQVIQAFAPYYGKDERITAAVDRAVEHLSKVQQENGGFFAWEGENVQTTAQVIIALSSIGIDIRTDERFIKEGGWIGSYFMQYYLGDGAFCHTLGMAKDPMATDQCMQAMIALELFEKGEGRFYDFTKIK